MVGLELETVVFRDIASQRHLNHLAEVPQTSLRSHQRNILCAIKSSPETVFSLKF
ncbi:BgTH12-02158 [Blumeria graminis f. sp. triticale]|uniref:BgTH12-02158 n=1 Tax=Blumeria graminis f. sp. triticale TaxID=1689686 RepID=A0A9W4D0G0_BLUGR|nr:BgTH12-02158 [Blumeria graminis f. sp. triticale]